MSVRLESVDGVEMGGPAGVKIPETLGEDGTVDCGREEEKSVMCVRV